MFSIPIKTKIAKGKITNHDAFDFKFFILDIGESGIETILHYEELYAIFLHLDTLIKLLDFPQDSEPFINSAPLPHQL